MKLELVPVPVADVDRAKAFYTDQVGFVEDVDVRPAEGVRVVQLTPPGSGCSIGMGTGLPAYDGTPGTIRSLHLVVADIERAAPTCWDAASMSAWWSTSGEGSTTPRSAIQTATPSPCRR